jgi:hypothetical protein
MRNRRPIKKSSPGVREWPVRVTPSLPTGLARSSRSWGLPGAFRGISDG